MNQAEALDIVSTAIWTILLVSGPAIGAAMVMGIVIALFQALTQIQEMTLTFIPKIVTVILVLYLAGPFMGASLSTVSQNLYDRIEHGFAR